jgi:hypothetical protein
MTTIRVVLSDNQVGAKLQKNLAKNKAQVNAAARGAAKDVIEYVVPRARTDIAGAGRFGARWVTGFKGKTTQGGGHYVVSFTMPAKAPMVYWKVFEYGATIKGKPLLWIPLSFAKDAQGIRARDYPGKLFRVNRKSGGAPLLLGGTPATPKYFGIASVTIPKKFHLRTIIASGAKQLKLFYTQRMKANG